METQGRDPSMKASEGDVGYFRPASMIRKIHGEGVVLLGGGRAILLQLSHPFVAAGVDDYSEFESEILRRLYNTLSFMHNLIYRDRESARSALDRFHAMHARIQGRLGYRSGQFSADTEYSGRDPKAKLWVHATFVDTGIKTYQRFVKPLTPEELHDYYSDTLRLARLMEIPDEIVPKTHSDFQNYMDHMLSGDRLAVTDTARRLAKAALYPDVGLLPSLSAGLLRFVTAGLLTERFRRAYGLNWNRKREHLLNGLSRTIRILRPFVPSWIWQNPLRKGKFTYYLLWGSSKPEKRSKFN